MPVLINGTPIVPAPIVTMSKEYIRNVGLGQFGAKYNIGLNGTLIAYKGNPEPSGFSNSGVYTSYSNDDPITSLGPEQLLKTITQKQEQIRALFASNPIELEIIGYDENKGIKAYCDVLSIQFDDQSRWTQTCGYSISLDAVNFIDSAIGGFSPSSSEDGFGHYVSEVDESWSFEEAEYTASSSDHKSQNKTYTISHSVSAVGQRSYNSSGLLLDPVSNAKDYVNNVIGLGSLIGFDYLPGNPALYNQKITENINPLTGSYSVTETFYVAPESATEVCSISVEEDTSAFKRVSINGTITGLDTSSYTGAESDKYENAEAYWGSISTLLYDRCNDEVASGCLLNTIPLSQSVGRNYTEGTISYSCSYDNRPLNAISGAKTEDIQVNDTYPGQLINIVPVIGRSQPIIQYLNARSEYRRSLQISAQMGGCPLLKPDYNDLIPIFDLYKPSGTRVYYSAPQESWNPRTGSYSYSIEWTYEKPNV